MTNIMSSKKITVKEYARVNGLNSKRTVFCINKKYDIAETKTSSQWEAQLIKDGVIDPKVEQKNEQSDLDSQ